MRRSAPVLVFALGLVLLGVLFRQPPTVAQDESAQPPLKWVDVPVDPQNPIQVARARIQGGWLVRTKEVWGARNGGAGLGVGLTFVPDRDHRWQIRKY